METVVSRRQMEKAASALEKKVFLFLFELFVFELLIRGEY